MTIGVDGSTTYIQKAEGGQRQGNGKSGPGAAILYPDPENRMLFPAKSLSIANLFPDETVEFPMAELDAAHRRQFAACFSAGARAY